jgi:two-component system response regulator NreC
MASILIADDSSVVRRSLRQILEVRPGLKICGKASNGAEAIKKAQELHPDLVILDLWMRDMNGFEAAKQILRVSPDLAILIVSVHFAEDLLREARKIGVRGFVQKGLIAGALPDAVDILLSGGQFFSGQENLVVRRR